MIVCLHLSKINLNFFGNKNICTNPIKLTDGYNKFVQESKGLDLGFEQREGRRQLCRPGPEPGHVVQPEGDGPQQRWILGSRIRIRNSHCHWR